MRRFETPPDGVSTSFQIPFNPASNSLQNPFEHPFSRCRRASRMFARAIPHARTLSARRQGGNAIRQRGSPPIGRGVCAANSQGCRRIDNHVKTANYRRSLRAREHRENRQRRKATWVSSPTFLRDPAQCRFERAGGIDQAKIRIAGERKFGLEGQGCKTRTGKCRIAGAYAGNSFRRFIGRRQEDADRIVARLERPRRRPVGGERRERFGAAFGNGPGHRSPAIAPEMVEAILDGRQGPEAFPVERQRQGLSRGDQARPGSQSTIPGKATSSAIVTASAMKNGVTPLNTS